MQQNFALGFAWSCRFFHYCLDWNCHSFCVRAKFDNEAQGTKLWAEICTGCVSTAKSSVGLSANNSTVIPLNLRHYVLVHSLGEPDTRHRHRKRNLIVPVLNQLCILKLEAACCEVPIIVVNGFICESKYVTSASETENSVRVTAKSKKARMCWVLSLILSCVVPCEIVFNSEEYTKQWRVYALPKCIARLAPVTETEHTADTCDVKIVQPVVFLHCEHR